MGGMLIASDACMNDVICIALSIWNAFGATRILIIVSLRDVMSLSRWDPSSLFSSKPMAANNNNNNNNNSSSSSSGLFFSEIQLPEQKLLLLNDHHHHQEVLFPTVLAPPPSLHLDIHQFKEAVRAQKPRIEELLLSSGAVLLRGYPLTTASDFDEVVEAFGYEQFPYVGGAASRTRVVGRVLTANESPPEQKIPFHHELAHLIEGPSKLFFFCEIEPRSGGETPIILSNRLYEMVLKKYPDFIKRLNEHGLLYKWILHAEDDDSVPVGRGWQSTFSTTDRNIAQERATQMGIKLEWKDNGVETTIGPNPAFKLDKTRGNKTWVNNIFPSHVWKGNTGDDFKAVTFGDGAPVPGDIIDDCMRVAEEECTAIPWKRGDILLLDNGAVLHSRRSFDPPRRILASFAR